MRKLIVATLVFGTAVLVGAAAWSQAPQNTVKQYFTTPLEKDATRIVRLQSVSIPAGGATPFHRHPGDQWEAVLEGEVSYTAKGQPPHLLKTGDSMYIPRGTVHRNQNLSDKPARTVELVIVDKDKPGLEQVND
jgi:quercetin dioxygenase-like cupin family protein